MKSIAYKHRQPIGSYGCQYLKELDGIIRIKADGSQRTERYALFVCGNCSNEFRAHIGKVKCDQLRACGCKRLTAEGLSTLDDGQASPLYEVWRGMIKRCQSVNGSDYKNYGERGISVCKEWQKSFRVFRDWAINNGYKKGLQIDRRNNDGNYEPTNCRFVTSQVNNSNKRNNRYCFVDGEKMTMAEASRKLGRNPQTLQKWSQGKFNKKVPSNLVFDEPIKCFN
jgi:hypothetical protein